MTLKRPIQLVREPEEDQKPLIFPLPSSEHGSAVVTCTVGAGTEWPTRTFTVHKNLLCRASEYFKTALAEKSSKSSNTELELPDDCPRAFEVFYHWMYTGFFYAEKLPMIGHGSDEDAYWVAVYNFADSRLIPHLKEHAIKSFAKLFNEEVESFPSVALTEYLASYGGCDGPSLLHEYLVGHVAFWLLKQSSKHDRWEELFKESDSWLPAQVAFRLAKHRLPISRRHPRVNGKFTAARAEAISLGYAAPCISTSSENDEEGNTEADSESDRSEGSFMM